jgi:phosphoglycolate phosphatase-like HAD superfamily hydrolase
MIRCIVFDFDGTLVESNQIKRQTFFELASEFDDGMRLMTDVMSEAADRERYWIFARFAAALPGQADAKTLADRYTRTCQERIACAPEIAGAKASLECLRAEGKLLFINSATPVEPLTRLVRLRRMDALFEGIYGSPTKKHENLEVIRSKHGLTPDEILVVGDGESDRASAKTLGCHFVAVDSAENDFTVEPPYRIPDLTGLPAIVSTMGFFGDRK